MSGLSADEDINLMQIASTEHNRSANCASFNAQSDTDIPALLPPAPVPAPVPAFPTMNANKQQPIDVPAHDDDDDDDNGPGNDGGTPPDDEVARSGNCAM